MQKFVLRAAVMTALLLVTVASVPALAQTALDKARRAVAEDDYTSAARLYEDAVRESPTDVDILLEAGDVNLELERYGAARALFERAADIDKKNQRANRGFAAALSALGEHPRAIEAVRRALKQDEKSLENNLALVKAYIDAGPDSTNRAELVAISTREKFPKASEPYVALGDLYFARGVYELAINQYEEALKLDTSLIEPRVRLGRAYREMAKRATTREEANEFYNKALQEFNRVTVSAPKLARPWYEQGEIFLLAEKFQEAGQSFEVYTKLRPEDPRGYVMLGRAAYGGNFFQVAVAPLEKVLAATDSISQTFAGQARAMLAKSYYAAKDYPKAAQMYALLPDTALNAEALKLFGSSLMLSGDTARALDVYRKLVASNPTDCELSSSLGNQLYKTKRYQEAIDVFTKRMVSCPTEPMATPLLYIGLSNYTLKKYDSAISAFSRSIAADSSQALPYYWLMNSFATTKQMGKAAGVARGFVQRGFEKTNPDWVATAYFFMGVDAFSSKKYKEAIDYFDQAIKLKPDYVMAYLYTAFSYQSLTDKENACKYYKLTLKYDPSNADAKKNMKALGCE